MPTNYPLRPPIPPSAGCSPARGARGAAVAIPCRSGCWRAVLLRQLGHHGVIGGVDGLKQLIVGDRAAGPQAVPAGPADVGHDGGVIGITQQPFVGQLAVRAAFQPHRGGLRRPQEREDLGADLHDDVALPRLVRPGAGLAQAIGEQLLPRHRGLPSWAILPDPPAGSRVARRGDPYAMAVKEQPSQVDQRELARILLEQWDLAPGRLCHLPVGFGDHHWELTDAAGGRWVVTVAELAGGRGGARPGVGYADLRASMETVTALRRVGLEFAVAPVPTASGQAVAPLGDGYTVALFPHIDRVRGDFGDSLPEHGRLALIGVLARLHGATPLARRTALARDPGPSS